MFSLTEIQWESGAGSISGGHAPAWGGWESPEKAGLEDGTEASPWQHTSAALSTGAAAGWPTSPGKIQGPLCKDKPAAGKASTCEARAGTSALRARGQNWTKTGRGGTAGAGTPELEEQIQQILCLQACRAGREKIPCTHTRHTHMQCGGPAPTVNISSTILALFTFCMNDNKHASRFYCIFSRRLMVSALRIVPALKQRGIEVWSKPQRWRRTGGRKSSFLRDIQREIYN